MALEVIVMTAATQSGLLTQSSSDACKKNTVPPALVTCGSAHTNAALTECVCFVLCVSQRTWVMLRCLFIVQWMINSSSLALWC